MTTALTSPLLLPSDLLLIPVADLPSASRAELKAADTDFAITRPRSRRASSIVDADSAALLEQFRSARTIADAVMDFSRARSVDPHAVLTGAYPMLQRLIAAQLLVPVDDPASKAIVASIEIGDRIGDLKTIRQISLVVDVELYQAQDADGSLCLVKLARPDGGERIARSLAREASILERLAGLAVPRVIERGEHHGMPYLALEWREGTHPIAAAAEHRRDDDRDGLLTACLEVARAYAALHARQITHGDVHDMNVLVDRAGRVTLIDFGLAYQIDAAEGRQHGRAGVFRNYDPELAQALLDGRSGPPATILSEQYAVGTLLYEMVTGQPYLDFAIRRDVGLKQIIEQPPRSFRDRGAREWPELEAVISRMLAKTAADRFASMATVVDALLALRPATASSVPAAGSRTAAFTKAIFRRLSLDGGLYRDGLPIGPQCSINNGAAGIAHAWYRRAIVSDDPATLAVAGAWARRAGTLESAAEAYFLPDESISPSSVGRAGLFHSPVGVHCVRALVARAGGEPFAARNAEDAFMRAARARSDKWDLVLGRTGVLLGAAFLHEADPSPKPTIERFGDRAAAWLTRRLAAAGSPTSSKQITALGVAHGWAGALYALLRWSMATRRPVDETIAGWLDELASVGTRSGRGASWPRFRNQSDYSLQATWCNGDTGFVFLWLLAAEALNDERFLIMAEDAGWNVADRGCERNADLCCGSAGRAYGFLALYRRTGDEVWLRRAKHFADHAARESDPDAEEAHRLYKGGLGVALLGAELEDPSSARMPLFEPEGWLWSRAG